MRNPIQRLSDWRGSRQYRKTIGKPLTPAERSAIRQWAEDLSESVEEMKAELGHHWPEGPGIKGWTHRAQWKQEEGNSNATTTPR